MPQHQRTGFTWTARRLAYGAALAREVRRAPAPARTPTPDPHETQVPNTTVDATLRPGPGQRYKLLVWGPGEPYIVREDLGARAGADRATTRQPILYFAHFTDAHICDAQSPGRLEAGERLAWLNAGTDAGHRPQEHSTVQVFDQMVRAMNRVAQSPVTAADMAFCIQTGDNTDNREYCELRWFIDTLDGETVTPNTGADHYEGVQAHRHLRWAYHPEDPSHDHYGRYGFPRLPGLLASAIRPIATEGSKVPWLAVMGNHDAIWQGTFGPLPALRFDRLGHLLAEARRKPVTLRSYGWLMALASIGSGSAGQRWTNSIARRGSIATTADGHARRGLPLKEYVAEHFRTKVEPGPVGHGFTEENLTEGTAYWSRPQGPHVQLIGLDTNNHTSGSEGRLGPRQLKWLEAQLQAHSSRWLDPSGREVTSPAGAKATNRLIVLFSHHNSWTMTNTVEDAIDPGRAANGEQVVELIRRYPNVVLWVDGHSHENRVLFHKGLDGEGSGIWEINTASCIDFGQQSRTVEVVDNGDGTLSIFATTLDHAAPASVTAPADGNYTAEQLASLSREFAANDARWIDPWEQRGELEDRNVELLVKAPFQRR